MSSTISKGPFGQEPTGAFNIQPPDHIIYVERFPHDFIRDAAASVYGAAGERVLKRRS